MLRVVIAATLGLALLTPDGHAQTRNLIKPSYLEESSDPGDCDPAEVSAENMELMQSQAAQLMASHGSLGTRGVRGANADVDEEALQARQAELADAARRGEAGNHSATYERLRDGDAFDPQIEGQTAVLRGNCVGVRPTSAPSRRR